MEVNLTPVHVMHVSGCTAGRDALSRLKDGSLQQLQVSATGTAVACPAAPASMAAICAEPLPLLLKAPGSSSFKGRSSPAYNRSGKASTLSQMPETRWAGTGAQCVGSPSSVEDSNIGPCDGVCLSAAAMPHTTALAKRKLAGKPVSRTASMGGAASRDMLCAGIASVRVGG